MIVSTGEILTAAHVVVGASALTVAGPDGSEYTATIVALDTANDLAVLATPELTATSIEFVELTAGDKPTIVGGAASGSLAAEVQRRVIMNVDEVRGTARNKRAGYELLAEIDGGDSGAGVFDDQGRLAAIVFAAPTQREGVAWVTGAEPIRALLGDSDRAVYACDPDASRVVRSRGAGG